MGALEIRERRLPHWVLEGSTYFVTFRSGSGVLSPAEVELVLGHIKKGQPRYYDLVAVTVMPDHVHILIEPKPGVALSRIMKGIKGVTARAINRRRGVRGRVWQDESWDRIVRTQAELDEKLLYMLNNALRRGLIDDPWQYEGWFLGEDRRTNPGGAGIPACP